MKPRIMMHVGKPLGVARGLVLGLAGLIAAMVVLDAFFSFLSEIP